MKEFASRVSLLFSVLLFILFALGFASCAKNSPQTPEGQPPESASLFERHPIDLNFPGIQYVKIVDLDGDGDLDVIGGSEITPSSASWGLAFWRNDGGVPLHWTKFVIDASFIHVMSVDAAYIDDDAHLDVVATSWQLNEVAWWRNSGNVETGWTKHLVRSGYQHAHDAQCVDIDGDGDMDIVTASSTPGSVDICYNVNSSQPAWNCARIDSACSGAKSVRIVNLTFDTNPEIVVTADGANQIAWLRKVGEELPAWSKTIIDISFVGACFADVVDVNGDSKFDVIGVAWSSNQVAYWKCSDLEANSWTKQIVTSNLATPVRAFGRDLDSDGDVDIVAVGKSPGRLVLFLKDGSTWTEQVLSSDFAGGSALAVADLDNDGDLDVVAGAGLLGDLSWWENKTRSASAKKEGTSPVRIGRVAQRP